MHAVDTNVLVRLVAHDDDTQLAAAERFIERGAWVSLVALAEVVWVLVSVYGRSRRQVAATVGVLLEHDRLTIQDADVAKAALATFRAQSTIGYTDCLVLEIARKAGHLPLGTFDKALGRLEGSRRVGQT